MRYQVNGYIVSASSTLGEVGYDPATFQFYVRFKNGTTGVYSQVSSTDAVAIFEAEDHDQGGKPSHGATLIRRLKSTGKPYRQLTDLPWDDSVAPLRDVSKFNGFVTSATSGFTRKSPDYATMLRNAVVVV